MNASPIQDTNDIIYPQSAERPNAAGEETPSLSHRIEASVGGMRAWYRCVIRVATHTAANRQWPVPQYLDPVRQW